MTTTKAGAHTQGLLHVCSHSNKVIRNDAGIWVADCNKLSGPTDGSVADAARLVACWNACEGLTQDHFDGGWTALGLSKHAKRVEDELAAARALLAECLVDVPATYVDPLIERIRAFLKGQK